MGLRLPASKRSWNHQSVSVASRREQGKHKAAVDVGKNQESSRLFRFDFVIPIFFSGSRIRVFRIHAKLAVLAEAFPEELTFLINPVILG